jgi:CRISPR-associated endonuclease/helicase Cas3
MVVLPSQLATYHNELGFMLLDRDMDIDRSSYQSAFSYSEGKKPKSEPLKHQSYLEHISDLVKAYDRSIRPSIQYVMRQLGDLTGLTVDTIDQAIRLAIACHDLGKLGQRWQQWAWDWQTLLFKEKGWPSLPDQSYFFAKTDFDYNSAEHRELRKKMKLKRPPHHACEGVALGMELIAASLSVEEEGDKREILLRAVCGAIAHHHTADAHEYGSIRLKQGAALEVKDALERAKEQASWTYELSLLETSELEGDDLAPTNAHALITRPKQGRLHEPEAWLYYVIARALRLADQRAGKFV